MKQELKHLVATALQQLSMDAAERPGPTHIQIERARDSRHGDFACNTAMILAKTLRRNPRELAQQIVTALPSSALVEKAEVAGAGFINFFLTRQAVHSTVREALAQAERYGRSDIGQGLKVQVEFVSANPTGPLHIGHGRGAAYGATIANLLAATGHAVQREYYVNDAGRQMDILAVSVWLRYLEALGEPVSFPDNAYRGAYVRDIAKKLEAQAGDSLRLPIAHTMGQFSPASDPDAYVDALIATAKDMLGPERYRQVHAIGLNDVLDGIRQDLANFGVEYDCWFSEGSLTEDDSVQRAIDKLETLGRLYLKDGARWFNSAAFGDEKDRVVVRENGQTTYFASDIAYHMHKFERGFEHVINVWGADHHGYAPRVKAALAALNLDPDKLEVLLVQFATLYRGKERVQMSTRSGEFVTLRELFEEVGKDAARFFYVLRRSEQHLDFDLELAKSQSSDNPVYYIQYAHARISSVMRQLAEKGLSWDKDLGNQHLDLLGEPQELALLNTVSRYPEVVEAAALNREPHLLAHYLRELANDFHVYYGAHQFLVDEPELRNARLNLIAATQRVIRNGLELLGVSSPEVM